MSRPASQRNVGTGIVCPTTGKEIKVGDCRCTPPEVVRLVRQFAPIGVDPCGSESSLWGAHTQYLLSRGEDGLALPWVVRGQPLRSVVPLNAPWSNWLPWVRKAVSEWMEHGVETIVISRPESATEWGKLLHAHATRIAKLSMRCEFAADGVAPGTDTISTQLAYLGERTERFTTIMRANGHSVWRPA